MAKAQFANLAAMLAERFSGKRYALTTSLMQADVHQLTVVVEGEDGHYPVHAVTGPVTGTQAEVQAIADAVNHHWLTLADAEVAKLVLRSMH
jgi:hypothetical protein